MVSRQLAPLDNSPQTTPPDLQTTGPLVLLSTTKPNKPLSTWTQDLTPYKVFFVLLSTTESEDRGRGGKLSRGWVVWHSLVMNGCQPCWFLRTILYKQTHLSPVSYKDSSWKLLFAFQVWVRLFCRKFFFFVFSLKEHTSTLRVWSVNHIALLTVELFHRHWSVAMKCIQTKRSPLITFGNTPKLLTRERSKHT